MKPESDALLNSLIAVYQPAQRGLADQQQCEQWATSAVEIGQPAELSERFLRHVLCFIEQHDDVPAAISRTLTEGFQVFAAAKPAFGQVICLWIELTEHGLQQFIKAES